MEMETRIKALEQELAESKDELRQVLLEIRSFILAAQNPLKKFERAGMKDSEPDTPEGGADHDSRKAS